MSQDGIKFTVLAALLVLLPAAAWGADPLSLPADQYLTACDKDEADCKIVINAVLMFDMINPAASKLVCIPEFADDDEALFDAEILKMQKGVINWLHEHPSPKDWDANHAVGSALGAMYPCKE